MERIHNHFSIFIWEIDKARCLNLMHGCWKTFVKNKNITFDPSKVETGLIYQNVFINCSEYRNV